MPTLDFRRLEQLKYRTRPREKTDIAGLCALLEQSAKETGAESPAHEGIARILDCFGDRLVTDSLVVLSEREEPIAAALVFLPSASGDDEVASLLGVVRPDHYEQGL